MMIYHDLMYNFSYASDGSLWVVGEEQNMT